MFSSYLKIRYYYSINTFDVQTMRRFFFSSQFQFKTKRFPDSIKTFLTLLYTRILETLSRSRMLTLSLDYKKHDYRAYTYSQQKKKNLRLHIPVIY